MSFDTDASDGAPTTKQAMEDQEPHADCMPSENLHLKIPRSMLKPSRIDAHYVRPAGLPGAADIKNYDVGNFYIASQGILNNATVGELHVRYKCRLSIPVLGGTVLAAPTNNSMSQFQGNSQSIPTTTLTQQFLATSNVTNGVNAVNTNGNVVLPVGNYRISVVGQGIFSGLGTDFALIPKKNGSAMIVGTTFRQSFASGQITSANVSIPELFYQSNGTDILTVDAL